MLQKPKAILWTRGIAIFQAVLAGIMILLTILVAAMDFKSGFLKGFESGLSRSLELEDQRMFGFYEAGIASTMPILALIASIFIILAIQKPSKNLWIASLILLGLHILFVLGSLAGIPIISIALFVLLVRKSEREYYIKKSKNTATN